MVVPATRIVITGVGLIAPNGNNLQEFRANLLAGKSGISHIEHRYFGRAPAGCCNFDTTRYRKKKENKKGTRAGCIAGILRPRSDARRTD
jgi:3-oxoacyl-[acyl-carrier-protein] synthase II